MYKKTIQSGRNRITPPCLCLAELIVYLTYSSYSDILRKGSHFLATIQIFQLKIRKKHVNYVILCINP